MPVSKRSKTQFDEKGNDMTYDIDHYYASVHDEKDFAISELKSYTWDTIKKELDKCICVCRNCHAEIHAGLIN